MSAAEVETPKSHKELVTQIITGVIGAIILGMQGINISETGGNAELIRRLEIALQQQSSLVQEVNHEGVRIDKALQNQQEMIQSMETLLRNQNMTLDLLKKEHEIK